MSLESIAFEKVEHLPLFRSSDRKVRFVRGFVDEFQSLKLTVEEYVFGFERRYDIKFHTDYPSDKSPMLEHNDNLLFGSRRIEDRFYSMWEQALASGSIDNFTYEQVIRIIDGRVRELNRKMYEPGSRRGDERVAKSLYHALTIGAGTALMPTKIKPAKKPLLIIALSAAGFFVSYLVQKASERNDAIKKLRITPDSGFLKEYPTAKDILYLASL